MKRELLAIISEIPDKLEAVYFIQAYFRGQKKEILDLLLRINMPVALAFYDFTMRDAGMKEVKLSSYGEYMVRTSSEQMADFWVDSYSDQYTKVVEKSQYMDPEKVALSFDDDLEKSERAIGEVVRVSNGASFQAAVDSGVYRYKQWVAILDGVTRDTHIKANGQIVPINSNFVVGLDLMLYPREIGASLKEVMNCRCHVEYIKEGEVVSGWYRPEGPQ